ncbi:MULTISPECIES: hypothetical protein [unclassified Streptomyces]|uniref:hypothetical protein n=1 Tax=unclassified Streptomyces TaxID=2593676 RepID=UPI001F524430|nr:hypothetical protein [Streptomyces sp. TSRI0281]
MSSTVAPAQPRVLCVEPPDAGVARTCLERGIHLVAIGATRRQLDAMAELHDPGVRAGATALLGVGVAPGLTNLLARRAHEAVGGAESLRLTVLLGSGNGMEPTRCAGPSRGWPSPPPRARSGPFYRASEPGPPIRSPAPTSTPFGAPSGCRT